MLQIQHLNPKVLAKLYLINLIARSIEIIDVSWITSNGYPSFIGDSTNKKGTFDGLFTTLYTYYSFLYIKLLITRATVYTDSLIIIRCSKNWQPILERPSASRSSMILVLGFQHSLPLQVYSYGI